MTSPKYPQRFREIRVPTDNGWVTNGWEITVQRGDLAYADLYPTGLVPVKVLRVGQDAHGAREMAVRVTADRMDYRRGEILAIGERNLVARDSVYVRNGQRRIGAFRTIAVLDNSTQCDVCGGYFSTKHGGLIHKRWPCTGEVRITGSDIDALDAFDQRARMHATGGLL